MTDSQLLKKDMFGEIRRISAGGEQHIVRDSGGASRWVRWLARRLLRGEASALAALADLDGTPELLQIERSRLIRSYLRGAPMQVAKPHEPAYFKAAARLLRQMHQLDVVHNDLAKEPNLLVRDDGSPAFIDFQLAWFSPQRGRLFRLLAYEDLRHLLKHKRTYCPQHLTRRELAILADPSFPSRAFRWTFKPVYMFVTRRLLGWSDREGAADRGDRS
ncbi:MAG: serine/threonine protein kinase [Gammaproteobacteria bacterium]|nr:serine/threonine protein kinase [Gammaproteobacteria bacterium]MDH3433405.1 serine/threonine protein kinase [Gammaproteobacteria bacterium]